MVYDARDWPNLGQLREVPAVRLNNPENTGFVPARLNIYNAHKSAITRQFAIEYNALFGAIRPTLERHDLPIPMGENSTRFRRRVLEHAGDWDPRNLTQDADF